jgi:eukaryotic-like serine/threonine-protein kinase
MDLALEAPPTCQAGDIVDGRYLVEQLVAIGGMASVFRATHLLLGRSVALKVLSSDFVGNTEIVARFLQEGRAASQLKSRHAVEVFDVGTIDTGAPYLAMEWLEGSDLADIAAREKLPVATVVDYVLQSCEALAEVHARGIVHRDIKPSNLFVTTAADGRPLLKLLDFGISKIEAGTGRSVTGHLGVAGTPSYMSPEQIDNSDETDARTDVWALGVVLFELLTGTLPFEGDELMVILSSMILKPRASCSEVCKEVPKALDEVISRCLSVDLKDRFASVSELAEALAPFASAQTIERADTVARIAETARESPIEVTVTPSDERWIKAAATPRLSPRGTPVPEVGPEPESDLIPVIVETDLPKHLVLVDESESPESSKIVTRHPALSKVDPVPLSRRAKPSRRRMLAIAFAVATFSIGIPESVAHVARSFVATVASTAHARLPKAYTSSVE